MAPGARRAPFGLCLLAVICSGAAPASTLTEDFAAGRLDPARWQRTQDGDFRTQSAEVVVADADAGYRRRLIADTRGTRDDSVKHHGVVSRCAITLGPDARLRLNIDWGPPANGSYLVGAVVLSPHATTGDPGATRDWLSLGYVGVPPGRNARLLVTARTDGVVRTLYTDGWPDRNREGRPIGRVEVDVAWRGSSLEIREDGRLVHTAAATNAPFRTAHVYLQISSHSNYPARAVHFANLRVRTGDDDSPVTGFPSAPDCGAGRGE